MNAADPVSFSAPLDPLEDGLPRHSDGYRLLELTDKYWPVRLDEWQRRLIVRILETDERGKLRFRQVLVLIPRQNGKSEIAGVLALYGLLQHVKGGQVIGIATTVDRANEVYGRTKLAVDNAVPLSKRLRASGTRGIKHRDASGGIYRVVPSDEDKLNGIPIDLGIADELHVMSEAAWSQMVNGQRSKPHGLLIGITTEGDETSTLLHNLRTKGEEAIRTPSLHPRFGAFLWFAEAGCALDDAEQITRANPAIACGRNSLADTLEDVKGMAEWRVRRYLLNQRVQLSGRPAVDHQALQRSAAQGVTDFKASGLYIGLDKAVSGKWVTIAAARRREDGVLESSVLMRLANPKHTQIIAAIDVLRASPHIKAEAWVMDNGLKVYREYLTSRGRKVVDINSSHLDTESAATLTNAMLTGRYEHDSQSSFVHQAKRAEAKPKGDGWRFASPKNGTPLDALHAVCYAVYGAEIHKQSAPALVTRSRAS